MKPTALPTNTDPDALLDETAAARFLGMSVRFLQKHRNLGDGPPVVRLSIRAVRYRRRDLVNWVESKIDKPAA